MPIYEFVCSKCGEEFEDLVPMNDPSTECPSCGSTRARRQMPSTVGIAFKGSGFYVTDNNKRGVSGNGKSSTKKTEEKETETDTSTKPSANSKDSKTESKPAQDSAKTAAA